MRTVREASPQSVLNESLGTALWRHLQGGIKYLRLTTRSLTRWLRFTYEILRSVESSMVTMYFAAVLASGIAPVATIALTSRLIDAVGTADRRGLALFLVATPWLVSIAVTLMVGHIAAYTQRIALYKLSELGGVEVTHRILNRTQRLDLIYLEHAPVYDMIARARGSVTRIIAFWVNLFHGISNLITLIASAALITRYAPSLGLLATLWLIPTFALRVSEVIAANTLFFEQTERTRRLDYLGHLLLSRETAKERRLFGLTPHIRARWNELFNELIRERLGLQSYHLKLGFTLSIIQRVFFLGLIAGAGWMVSQRMMTVGVLVAIIMALNEYFTTQRVAANSIYWGIENGERVGYILDFLERSDEELLRTTDNLRLDSESATNPVEPQHFTKTSDSSAKARTRTSNVTITVSRSSRKKTKAFPSPLQRGIFCENLRFSYPGRPTPVLCDVTIEIPAGTSVAFVGENGSGKTTLAKILCGLYHPDSGDIFFDDCSIHDIDPTDLRKHVGAVFQDFARYELLAREAIGIARIDAIRNTALLREAASKAGIDHVLSALPVGYDTPLGKTFTGGVDLSGGEWQRLAIARAFLRDSQILILDEPTAALDPSAEASIYRQFQAAARGRTTIMISHRLGSTKFADRIFVFEKGRVVEQGTHEQLMQMGGIYQRMFSAQAEWYR